MSQNKRAPSRVQTAIGVGVLAIAIALAVGAIDIPSDAGYGGVGPNFLPWAVSVVLALCGLGLLREARNGGFRHMEEDDAPDGAPAEAAQSAYWPGFVWLSAGLLLNAALITQLGFVLACTLCYVLATQGLRRAQGQTDVGSVRRVALDLLAGLAISAPVYWMFTKFLAINLPGLTSTGWL